VTDSRGKPVADPRFSLVGPVTALPHVSPGPYVLTIDWPEGPKSYPVQVTAGAASSIAVP